MLPTPWPVAGASGSASSARKGTMELSCVSFRPTSAHFKELNIPAVLSEIAEAPNGLILVTGPTGNGKSTTLASMLRYLNENHSYNIITIEDPIEFIFTSQKSCVIQREVGIDTDSFSAALKAALRMDPDVIMVGEMRDKETIDACIKAAETGHLVFSSLHTNGAVSTINRIIGHFPPECPGNYPAPSGRYPGGNGFPAPDQGQNRRKHPAGGRNHARHNNHPGLHSRWTPGRD